MSTLKVNQITDLNDAEIFEPNLMTAQSASGTSVDFTDIPSWVKRITVMFRGVSTNGTSSKQVQLGVSGTPVTTGYSTQTATLASSSSAALATTGFPIISVLAADVISGQLILSRLSDTIWVGSGITIRSSTSMGLSTGSVDLGGTLNMIRVTTVNGTDTFDAGTINVMYE